MEKTLKYLNKYWVVIVACATIISTSMGMLFHLKGLIDKNVATINQLNTWVAGHDDDISDLHDKVVRLEALEEARDRQCK